jgi:hypothetical protein
VHGDDGRDTGGGLLMGLSPGTFADPPGDPDAIEDAAARLADLAADLDLVAAQLRTQVPDTSGWRGHTADAVRTSATGTAVAITRAAAAIQPSATALRTWAAHLRGARSAMRGFRSRHDDEVDRHARQMRRLEQEAATAAALLPPAVSSGAGLHPGPVPGPNPSLRRGADHVRDDLDAQALASAEDLMDLRVAHRGAWRATLAERADGGSRVRGVAVIDAGRLGLWLRTAPVEPVRLEDLTADTELVLQPTTAGQVWTALTALLGDGHPGTDAA